MLVALLLFTDSEWCCSEPLVPHLCLNATLKFHLTQNANATSKDLVHNLHVYNLVSGCEGEEAAIQHSLNPDQC